MGYCAQSDIEAEFKSIDFTTSTNVKAAAVAQFILEADALINSYVGSRWQVPITGDASSLALMSLFSRTLVSDRIRGILSNKQTTNIDANQNVKAQGFGTSDVMKALNEIKAGNVQLSGATLLLESAGFYSNNQSNDIQPVFRKDRKQW